ncbi:MAG: hypothetical protein ACRD2A_02325 [Vicinamibacterales bacterium]
MGNARDHLACECGVFCRYLADLDATPEIVHAYRRAHDIEGLKMGAATPIDRALLRLASGGPTLTRMADAFAAVAARDSALRKKLVVLIAILESRSASAAVIDSASPGSRLAWAIGAAAQGGGWLLRFVLAALLLAPLRLWYGVSPQR